MADFSAVESHPFLQPDSSNTSNDELIHRARLNVCAHAVDAEEAIKFMMILDIIPQELKTHERMTNRLGDVLDPNTWLALGPLEAVHRISRAEVFSHVLAGSIAMKRFDTNPITRFRATDTSSPLPPIPHEHILLGYEEAADFLGLSLTGFNKELARGDIRRTKFDRRSFVKVAELEMWQKRKEGKHEAVNLLAS